MTVTPAENAARMAFYLRSNCNAIDPRDGDCIHENGAGEGCSCLDAAREIIAAWEGAGADDKVA